jgi:hypothetical protein
MLAGLAAMLVIGCASPTAPRTAEPVVRSSASACDFGVPSDDVEDYSGALVVTQSKELDGRRVRVRGVLISAGYGSALFYASRWDSDFWAPSKHEAFIQATDRAVKPGLGWDMPAVVRACERLDVLIEATVRISPPDAPKLAPSHDGLVEITRVTALRGEPLQWQPGAVKKLLESSHD